MTTQTTSPIYDFIKPPARADVKGSDNRNNKGYIDKLPDEDTRDVRSKHKDEKSEKSDRFNEFVQNINTTVKKVVNIEARPEVHNNKGYVSIDDIFQNTPDALPIGELILASEEPILSDLISLDLDALQDGETLIIAGGIEVSLDNNILTFSLEGEIIETPVLTFDQFELALQNIINPDVKNSYGGADILSANFAPPDAQIFSGQNLDIEEFAPPITALTQTIEILQNIAQTAQTSQTALNVTQQVLSSSQPQNIPQDILKNFNLQSDLAETTIQPDVKKPILQSSAQSLSATLSSQNGSAAQGIGASGLQNILAQNNGASSQNFSASFKETLTLNAPLVTPQQTASEEAAETLTQFLNNNNLRVVREGHLQSTQPLPSSQLNVILSKMANGSQFKKLSVRLDPAELGRVDIELKTRTADNSLKAHITVERPEALALLRKDIHQLEKMLSEAGLDLDENSISFDLSEGGDKDSQTQEALKDLWRERNEDKLASNLHNELTSEDDLVIANYEEFYQTDDALNIKV